MTRRGDFTDEEWELLRDGTELAGLIVITAERGGTLRETFALAKVYAEARKQQGESELLDELASAGPKRGNRYQSAEELRSQGLQRLREAADLLGRKASIEEVEAYRAFVMTIAEKVAQAHREGDETISGKERAALDDIAATLAS
jgi:hypothetical protein